MEINKKYCLYLYYLFVIYKIILNLIYKINLLYKIILRLGILDLEQNINEKNNRNYIYIENNIINLKNNLIYDYLW